jgi:hypothetical protein
VKDILARTVEFDQLNAPITLLGLVIDLPLAAQPAEDVAVALGGSRRKSDEPRRL